MRPTASQYAEALEALSEEGTSAEILAKNFLGFLKRRGESGKLAAVVAQLDKRGAARSGTLSVTVVTAHEAEASTRALLLKQATLMFPGVAVNLQYQVDASIIGGVRFRAEEILYDATVLAELSALKKVIHT